MSETSCKYVGPSGVSCSEAAQGQAGLCYWHDPAVSKSDPGVKSRLEKIARSARSLEGYVLRGADLRDADLTFGDTNHRVDLSHADLSRADLTGGHMFNADLHGASLLKTRLNNANLNNADLEDANLLGVELEGTRLERARWGKDLRQERLARAAHREGREDEAMDLYAEAEQISRHLTAVNESRGHYILGGYYYHKEKIMRRMQMRLYSREWATSKLVDLLCGYGEDTHRVIGFSLGVVLVCAVLYFLFGVRADNTIVVLNPKAGLQHNVLDLLTCCYFSVVTFTTVGFGDVVPVGLSRVVAAIEAFIGVFSISLFVVVFVRKMMR
jgi:hypothetical protein